MRYTLTFICYIVLALLITLFICHLLWCVARGRNVITTNVFEPFTTVRSVQLPHNAGLVNYAPFIEGAKWIA